MMGQRFKADNRNVGPRPASLTGRSGRKNLSRCLSPHRHAGGRSNVRGRERQTARGRAEWDGQKFRPGIEEREIEDVEEHSRPGCRSSRRRASGLPASICSYAEFQKNSLDRDAKWT